MKKEAVNDRIASQIEYKALPNRPESPPPGKPLADPRTSDLYFLFEERVPLDYQLAVADPKQKRTFANLFSPKPKKGSDIQTIPRVASGWEDSDFDRMLLHGQKSKKLSVVSPKQPRATVWHASPDHGSPVKTPVTRQRTQSSVHRGKENDETQGRAGFFSKSKEKVIRRVKTSEGQRERARREKEHHVEFELHSASGVSSGNNSPEELGRWVKPDEKWMGERFVSQPMAC